MKKINSVSVPLERLLQIYECLFNAGQCAGENHEYHGWAREEVERIITRATNTKIEDWFDYVPVKTATRKYLRADRKNTPTGE